MADERVRVTINTESTEISPTERRCRMFEHDLKFDHRRRPTTVPHGEAYADSRIRLHANSCDLTEAWRELLSRMPDDAYAALKEAMKPISVSGDGSATRPFLIERSGGATDGQE